MREADDVRRHGGRVRLPSIALAVLALLMLAALTLAPSLTTYLEQRERVAEAAERIAAQRADLAAMDDERARWDDPAYVKAQAGTRLYYVLPGTTAYRVINGSAAPAGAAQQPAATPQAVQHVWTDTLVRSLVEAGTTVRVLGELETAG